MTPSPGMWPLYSIAEPGVRRGGGGKLTRMTLGAGKTETFLVQMSECSRPILVAYSSYLEDFLFPPSHLLISWPLFCFMLAFCFSEPARPGNPRSHIS